ncbi:LysR family transcriptional regulator [Roseibium sp. MMSF_3544]|uniref:LysR family transcriptional regulator n=1 Tax=unclassified Roseibium TaxID=2629323 RepID=UPI00273EDD2F|nr:LysR family transcriptional regulator [Roseibium sp. MMSF_3544]
MENWNEIRTAYELLRCGTVSATADVLKIHRATVIRHIDALEALLGEKLFIRSAKGYVATEVGADLLNVAAQADEHFRQFATRAKSGEAGLTGDIILTADGPILMFLLPTIREFQKSHPHITVRFIAERRVLRLDYGEAHVAIRLGNRPEEPDNVVQHFKTIWFGLYGSELYIKNQGDIDKKNLFTANRWALADNDDYVPDFYKWLRDRVPEENVAFLSNDPLGTFHAVEAGIGLGFLPRDRAARQPGLKQIVRSDPDWGLKLWLVTHVDRHRSAKVQTFLEFLKEHPVESVDY